jgi:hypothetical protein
LHFAGGGDNVGLERLRGVARDKVMKKFAKKQILEFGDDKTARQVNT